MRKTFLAAIVSVAACLLQHVAGAEPPKGVGALASVKMLDGKSVMGELKTEDEKSITLIDASTGLETAIERSKVAGVKRDLSDDAAIAASDLPTVVAWKLGQLREHAKPTIAKIARVTPMAIYTTFGESAPIKVGEHLDVFHNEGDIKDPDTGKILGSDRLRIGEVEIFEIHPAYSKAKPLGSRLAKIEFTIGDEVEAKAPAFKVAVVPPFSDAGIATPEAVAWADGVAATLLDHKIAIIETTPLLDAIADQAIKGAELYEPTAAQKLGRKINVTAMLTGKVIPKSPTTSDVQLRLIDVATGEVLLATTSPLRVAGPATASVKADPVAATPLSGEGPPKGKAPLDNHVIVEDEHKGTLGGWSGKGFKPYMLTIATDKPKVRLAGTYISARIVCGNDVPNHPVSVRISADYGKTWIPFAELDTAAIMQGRRNNHWYHFSVDTAGVGHAAQRQLKALDGEYDQVQVDFDLGYGAEMVINTVVWSR